MGRIGSIRCSVETGLSRVAWNVAWPGPLCLGTTVAERAVHVSRGLPVDTGTSVGVRSKEYVVFIGC